MGLSFPCVFFFYIFFFCIFFLLRYSAPVRACGNMILSRRGFSWHIGANNAVKMQCGDIGISRPFLSRLRSSLAGIIAPNGHADIFPPLYSHTHARGRIQVIILYIFYRARIRAHYITCALLYAHAIAGYQCRARIIIYKIKGGFSPPFFLKEYFPEYIASIKK